MTLVRSSTLILALALPACRASEPYVTSRSAPDPEAGANPEGRYRRVGPFGTGIHPNEVAIGDFDGDGDPDIVVPGLVEPTVTVLRNDGDGRFTPLVVSPLPAGPTDVEAADLDGDGRPELVAATFEEGRVLVLEASAELDFTLVSAVELGGEPAYLEAADLDGDGHLDLAVSRFRGNDVVPLYGDGALGLTPGASIAVSSRPGGLCICDPDGDGSPEIAVASAGAGEVHLLALDPVEGWRAAASAATSAWPTSVAAGDVDGDGAVELVGATNLGNALFVADIEMSSEAAGLTVREQPAGYGAFDIAIADLDGDGRQDVAVTYKNENRLAIHRGTAQGELLLATSLDTGDGPTPVRAVDLNADGALDLVVVNGFSNDVEIFLAEP